MQSVAALLLSLSAVSGGFTCPEENSADSCSIESMPNCGVCNEGSTSDETSIEDSYVGCSQCASGYWLYHHNQCLSCNETFGAGCQHCTDTTGCQQCESGYTRVKEEECGLIGVYYCEEDTNINNNPCDIEHMHCQHCQSNNGVSICAQCKAGYFRADTTGTTGCIHCQEEYGDECRHCSDTQGCQQCEQGYLRVQDTTAGGNGLHYCQCNSDECEILDFEDLEDFYEEKKGNIRIAGVVPNYYYGLSWPQDETTLYFLIEEYAGIFPGVAYLDESGEFGNYAYVHNSRGDSFTIGTGNESFRLISFEVILANGDNWISPSIKCKAYYDYTLKYAFDKDLKNDHVTPVYTNNGNTVIDFLTCEGVDDFLITDNYNLIVV